MNSQIVVVGTSHKHAPINIRERLGCNPEEQATRLKSLLLSCKEIQEVVLLSTCNRTEVYALSADVMETASNLTNLLSCWSSIPEDELKQCLYVLLDEEAIRHLFRVSTGLDSLVPGERQIEEQVREAGRLANQMGTSGRNLSDLFHHAYNCSLRIRRETELGSEDPSVSTTAITLLKKHSEVHSIRSILLIGAGKMIRLAAKDLSALGGPDVWVANRTAQRAEELANRTGGRSVQFEKIPEVLESVDAVLSCTSATNYLITAHDLRAIMQRRHNAPLVMIDASVPRNIDPEVAKVSGVQLFNIDDLASFVNENRDDVQSRIDAAEKLIETETSIFLARIRSFDANNTLKDLRRLAEKIREKELERALRRMGRVSAREEEILDVLTQRIVNKLLYEPTARLKEHARNGDGNTYEAVIRDLFAINQEAE